MKLAFWHFYTFRMHRGIETLVVSLANALAQKGIEMSIVTAKPTIRPLVSPDRRVSIFAYPAGRYYEHSVIVPSYTYHYLRHRYDHVLTFFADFGEGITSKVLRPFVELPLSIYLCYPYSSVPHRYESFRRLGWDKIARHIFADADWIAREAEDYFGRPVPVVPVGTDPERFCPNAERRMKIREQLGFKDSDVVLLNVSALERRKGTWRVIQSLSRVRKQVPDLRYYILGAGGDLARLTSEVGELGLQDIVTFGGLTSELENYYNAADVFVMLPDAEANSVACHEAMSSGLPVVASSTGGFAESVPSEAGILVDPDCPEEIDNALVGVAADEELRRSMGINGRRHIMDHYTWSKAAERLLEVLA
jgi:glycosyltransferase involved in cell wall biosynthesis